MQFVNVGLALLATAGAGLAAPLQARSADKAGTAFQLLWTNPSNTTYMPPPVAALANGTWALGVRNSHAVLYPSTASGLIFYEYGNGPSIAYDDFGIVITPGGTATVPNNHFIDYVAGNATTGVTVSPDTSGDPALSYEGGRFQACAGDDEIFISYIAPGQRQYGDCAVVDLIATCAESCTGDEGVGELGAPISVSCH